MAHSFWRPGWKPPSPVLNQRRPEPTRRRRPAWPPHDTAAGALGDALAKIVDLAPITVNLAVPNNILMRLQIAVKTTGLADEATLELVHQDITAYVRQLRLDQLRSPNGYLRIRDDLQRRARIRSEGGITDLYVRMMVFE